MKQSALSNSDKRLLFFAGAIIVLAAAYFLVFSNLSSAAETIEEENEALEEQLKTLQSMLANVNVIEAETEEMIAARDEIIATYPAGVTVESAIERILGYESQTGITFSSTSFNLGNSLSVASSSDETTSSGGVYGYYATLSLSYEASYEDLKDFMSYVLNENDRTVITSISMAHNSETGAVSGTISINLYYMIGTDVEYVTPEFSVSEGVSNLFGN